MKNEYEDKYKLDAGHQIGGTTAGQIRLAASRRKDAEGILTTLFPEVFAIKEPTVVIPVFSIEFKVNGISVAAVQRSIYEFPGKGVWLSHRFVWKMHETGSGTVMVPTLKPGE